MTRGIRADAELIEIDCKVDGMAASVVFHRTRTGRLKVTFLDGFGDPQARLGRRKTKALVNWLAATQGIEPDPDA